MMRVHTFFPFGENLIIERRVGGTLLAMLPVTNEWPSGRIAVTTELTVSNEDKAAAQITVLFG